MSCAGCKWLWCPSILRFAFIPLFLLCKPPLSLPATSASARYCPRSSLRSLSMIASVFVFLSSVLFHQCSYERVCQATLPGSTMRSSMKMRTPSFSWYLLAQPASRCLPACLVSWRLPRSGPPVPRCAHDSCPPYPGPFRPLQRLSIQVPPPAPLLPPSCSCAPHARVLVCSCARVLVCSCARIRPWVHSVRVPVIHTIPCL